MLTPRSLSGKKIQEVFLYVYTPLTKQKNTEGFFLYIYHLQQ